MSAKPSPPSSGRPETPPLSILARALVASALVLLGVGYVVHRVTEPGGPLVVAWIAIGWALVSPLVASLVRGQGLIASPDPAPRSAAAQRADFGRQLAFFAVLESAALLCGVALMVGPTPWPFAAGLLPIVVMIVNLPAVR